MQLDPRIKSRIEQEMDPETEEMVRTSSIFALRQIEAIERIAGEKRAPGQRRFARVFRLVLDAGINAVQGEAGLTPRTDAAKPRRGVATATAVDEV